MISVPEDSRGAAAECSRRSKWCVNEPVQRVLQTRERCAVASFPICNTLLIQEETQQVRQRCLHSFVTTRLHQEVGINCDSLDFFQRDVILTSKTNAIIKFGGEIHHLAAQL
jgi:hypothetical protein